MIRYNVWQCLSSLNKSGVAPVNMVCGKLNCLSKLREQFVKSHRVFSLVVVIFITVSFSWPPLVSGNDNIKGKVVETIDSGSYTYVLLGESGKKQWVAVPRVIVRAGDNVEVESGFEMGNYTSPTTGRVFENIIFSGGVINIQRVVGSEKDEKPGADVDAIEKAAGPDGYSIVEVFAQKDTLNGKRVVVKGKVVKTSKFQNKNWLRLVDGTGSRKRGNHKLVAVTQQEAEKGDTITISGTLAVNKSYGFLTYEVLVEEAELIKQD